MTCWNPVGLCHVIIISLLLVPQRTASGQSAPEVAKRAFQSTLLLVLQDSNGQPLSLGSGFLVSKGTIATNLHVVEGATTGYAKLVGKEAKYPIEGLVAVDEKRDLVMLKVSDSLTNTLSIADSDKVEVGERVFAVGNPQGLEGTFSQGIVSCIRQMGTDTLLQITAPVSPGSSGGPVLNSRGDVIGVSMATFRGGQNLNFAVPSKYIGNLAKTIDTSNLKPLAATMQLKTTKSSFAGVDDRGDVPVSGERFTWDALTQEGRFSFSVRNRLREPIGGIRCLVILYDHKSGGPIDYTWVVFNGPVPAQLAKRVSGKVIGVTEQLNSPPLGGFHGADDSWNPPRSPRGKVEVRILDFTISASESEIPSMQPPVSSKPLPNPPGRRASPTNSIRVVSIEEHTISQVLGRGMYVVLDDGTRWRVDEGEEDQVDSWGSVEVLLKETEFQGYRFYEIVNTEDRESVRVRREP